MRYLLCFFVFEGIFGRQHIMSFDIFLQISELVLIPLEIFLFQIRIDAFLLLILIRRYGFSRFKGMQLDLNKFELLLIGSLVNFNKIVDKVR